MCDSPIENLTEYIMDKNEVVCEKCRDRGKCHISYDIKTEKMHISSSAIQEIKECLKAKEPIETIAFRIHVKKEKHERIILLLHFNSKHYVEIFDVKGFENWHKQLMKFIIKYFADNNINVQAHFY